MFVPSVCSQDVTSFLQQYQWSSKMTSQSDIEIILWQLPHMIVQITKYLTNALVTNTSLIL
jgi:hypothetical protein